MYGTVARIRVKPGQGETLQQMNTAMSENIPGLVFEHVYQSDADANEYWLVVGFESKAAYVSNANAPEQHDRYLQLRELLDADPEWHDGAIAASWPA
jgi:heme-degrading monooxygenase HmoA